MKITNNRFSIFVPPCIYTGGASRLFAKCEYRMKENIIYFKSKVEFKGVLEGEATILRHLATHCAGAVPDYLDYVKEDGNICAIIMEFLTGEDMHMLRDKASANQDRRLHVNDAVYLTADVMLPLLKKMHDCGVIHRDVKPSNCVRMSPTKVFKMVDFGLSKSFVVPESSPFADAKQPWDGIWSSTVDGEKGNIRQERPKAEFRGTSMYASLPVHQ